nr:zf-HC2 domain-containing protein [Streptomyces sp. CC228A]
MPPPRQPADDRPSPGPPVELPHGVLRSLLGAWALAACSAEETAAVEAHLTECAPCADEALRLRDAVALLHSERDLDLDPLLRSSVLENCLGRRPARIPVPAWAGPYDAETARLDALLRDFGEPEWHAPVRLRWFEDDRPVQRRTSVAAVIAHLLAVDGLVAAALQLDDPLREAPSAACGPAERTEAFWRLDGRPPTREVRGPWREQAHTLVRTVSFAGRGVAELPVGYGGFSLPLRDAFLDRAFECWTHAEDIAAAVDYPYEPPAGAHLRGMVALAAEQLPVVLAQRRRAGLAAAPRGLVAAGAPGRSLHLEIEGAGGGEWYVALDSPAAAGSPDRVVAQVALDAVEFCRLVAGRVTPEEAAAGQAGDRAAVREVLYAAASMSRI